jgi:hypothetical protein
MKPGMRGFQTLTAPMMQNRGNSNFGGKYMAKGGMAKDDAKEDMAMDKSQDKAMIKKAFKQHDMQEHKGGKGTSLKLSKGGSASSRADGIAQRGKTRGTMC